VSGGSTVAVSVQFCWPPAFKNLAVCVQDLVAADTRADRLRAVHPRLVSGGKNGVLFLEGVA